MKANVGGKAQGLLRLQQLGLPVPTFLVISSDVFEMELRPVQTQEQAKEMALRLLDFQLPDGIKSIILTELHTWNFPLCSLAVRSSIADEDGTQHAFAGVMDSFLNIQNEQQLWRAIQKVGASAYGDRAIEYRKTKGISLHALPSVIVQVQVEAVASGVIFSTFPEYPQEVAIHAVWGFGEGLVQGMIEPDEFYVLKSKNTIHRKKVSEKTKAFYKNQEGGLAESEVPEHQRLRECIDEQDIHKLYQISQQLESQFKAPQDIEFVIDKGQIWLVQSRPITQAIPEVIVYDNSNIQESYCGVTTPLTYSFAKRAYATVYRQTMQTLGLSKKQIKEKEPITTQLLGLVKGRIYYNINNWYRGLQLLPSFKQNKSDMERMMGLTDPVDFIEDHEKSFWQKVKMLPSLILNLTRLMIAFGKLGSSVHQFRAHFKAYYQKFYHYELPQLPPNQLFKIKNELDEQLLNRWSTPIINDFYVMMNNGQTVRKLKSAGVKDVDDFLSQLLSGDHQMENTEPTKKMLLLAAIARNQKDLKALILSENKGKHQQVQIRFPDFAQQVDQFISDYGDRTVGELKLETITMRVNAQVFYNYLCNYLTVSKLPTIGQESSFQKQAQVELDILLGKLPFWKSRSLQKSLRKLKNGIRNREALRMERTRLFGMYRSVYLGLGKHYVQKGIIINDSDIFYLEESEIFAAQTTHWNALIQKRKLEFAAYQQEEVPTRVIIPFPPVNSDPIQDENPILLQGTGCFPGEVEGECILVTSPEQRLDLNGKIVVALRTDPGWAALFPTCRAVLIEKGSSLSHSVILLRELGIPTIINIPRLTQRIKNGDQVIINSKSGKIKIVNP